MPLEGWSMDSRQMEESVGRVLRGAASGVEGRWRRGGGEKKTNKHKIMGVTFDMQMEGPVRNINPSHTHKQKVLLVNFWGKLQRKTLSSVSLINCQIWIVEVGAATLHRSSYTPVPPSVSEFHAGESGHLHDRYTARKRRFSSFIFFPGLKTCLISSYELMSGCDLTDYHLYLPLVVCLIKKNWKKY